MERSALYRNDWYGFVLKSETTASIQRTSERSLIAFSFSSYETRTHSNVSDLFLVVRFGHIERRSNAAILRYSISVGYEKYGIDSEFSFI